MIFGVILKVKVTLIMKEVNDIGFEKFDIFVVIEVSGGNLLLLCRYFKSDSEPGSSRRAHGLIGLVGLG